MNPSDPQTVEEIGAIPLPESFLPRGVMPPVPPSVSDWLDSAQQLSLRTMEYFGWQLWFIRRQQLPAVVDPRWLQSTVCRIRAGRTDQSKTAHSTACGYA